MWLGHVLRQESLLYDTIEGRVRGKGTRGRKGMHLMTGKYVALKRTAEYGERVAEIVKSLKSYTCFSTDYLSE